MAGVNKAIIVGNVGNDPETRAFPDGTTIMNISIATSESWKDQSGQKQERTEWHRVVLTGGLADALAPFIKKGSKLYVEGKLVTRKWQNQNGEDRYTTEIRAKEIQLLDRREDNQQQTGNYGYQQPAAQPQQPSQQQFSRPPANQYEQARQQPAHTYQQPAGGEFDEFDDIPF